MAFDPMGTRCYMPERGFPPAGITQLELEQLRDAVSQILLKRRQEYDNLPCCSCGSTMRRKVAENEMELQAYLRNWSNASRMATIRRVAQGYRPGWVSSGRRRGPGRGRGG